MNRGDDFERNDNHVRRPFKFDLEAWVARDFINACRDKGVFVRETIRGLMIKFINEHYGREDEIDVEAANRNRDTEHRR